MQDVKVTLLEGIREFINDYWNTVAAFVKYELALDPSIDVAHYRIRDFQLDASLPIEFTLQLATPDDEDIPFQIVTLEFNSADTENLFARVYKSTEAWFNGIPDSMKWIQYESYKPIDVSRFDGKPYEA